MPQVASRVPMGWFPVAGTADVRWWDGAGWTPYRLREGTPRPDAFAIEPANISLVLGFMFIVLGATQFGTYTRYFDQSLLIFTPVLLFVVGFLWLFSGVRARRLTKLPAPTTLPVFVASTRPLPGEVEEADAGWYSMSGQVTRWWTGARWSPYIQQKLGVRPTHSGERAYRISMITGWIFAGLGALGTVLGFILIYALVWWVGAAIVVAALLGGVVGGLMVVFTCIRRYTMILPPHAPTSI
jgi:hypothetical protein